MLYYEIKLNSQYFNVHICRQNSFGYTIYCALYMYIFGITMDVYLLYSNWTIPNSNTLNNNQ